MELLPSKLPAKVRVYKEECMFNFDTAENNPNGLDVCLQCFQAFSRPLYTDQHEHKLFLNIKKTLKQTARNEAGESPSKIAKLEIKEVPEHELYDIEYAVYTQEGGLVPLLEAPTNVQELAHDIINCNSSERQDDIKTWELEIKPCEHTYSLTQDPINLDIHKCSNCDLKENLWICLSCGVIGCGRQQYGSDLKGNSHMVGHYESTKHPIAIKLGSLDIDSHDAYCYTCNDEVKIPELADKLQIFGINLAESVKTEKNLAELNLDQNLNWDFKLEGVNGQLEPIFGPGYTGLKNLGNSCYLNSVIQSLFSLDAYKEYFQGKEFPKVADPGQDLACQLIKLYNGLESGQYSFPSKEDGYQSGIKPAMFKNLIGEGHVEFASMKQQDAFEFLVYYLEKSGKIISKDLNSPFEFILQNRLFCSSCNHVKLSDEVVDNLALPLDIEQESVDEDGKIKYKEIDLNCSFKQFCSKEVLTDFKCPNCQAGMMEKSIEFKSFPDVLLVNAKRIMLQNWVPIKVDAPIAIPNTIELSNFKAKGLQEGEILFEEEKEETQTFKPNNIALQSLMEMGFPEARSIKALYTTGNESAESAMNWLFEHMEDPDIDVPLDLSQTSSVNNSNDASSEQIENFIAMGFSAKLAKKALHISKGRAELAVEWLFNNPEDDGEIDEIEAGKSKMNERIEKLQTKTNSKFKLKAVVCHKGSSPHTGHYVAFIKKEINGHEKWVLFNDEKVVICDEDVSDIVNNGYVYIFSVVK